MYASSLLVTAAALPAALAAARVGKLPALAYNTWNAFAADFTEDLVIDQANAIIKLGLKDAGYNYINIDDGWASYDGRDPTTRQLRVNGTKFPNGFADFTQKIHNLGLMAGIYGDAGTMTCQNIPQSGSINSAPLDAQTWASWNVDYLKYDNCNVPSNWTDQYNACEPDNYNFGDYGNHPNGTCPDLTKPAPAGYNWTTSLSFKRYDDMSLALAATNRSIQYALCSQGEAEVHTWGAKVAVSWRVTNDIIPYWYRAAQIINDNSFKLNYVDFYAHNDMDMLEVGNGNLSTPETRSHFALWAAAKSPLIIGSNVTNLSSTNVEILSNKYLIAFNQDDSYGKPATPYKWGYNPDWTFDPVHPAEYWSGKSKAGTLVLLLNTENNTATRTVSSWDEVPGLQRSKYRVTDIWSGKSLGCISGVRPKLDTHDTAGYLVGDKCW